jgi:Holliday junction DNA helicase RuvA
MISRIRGKLVHIDEHSALVEAGGLTYEVMVPSALADRLTAAGITGQDQTFETIYYIEAGDRKSSHYPRLVGFTDPVDREFFSLLLQVSGLGVKKALKCLVLPIRDIATAIENKQAATLSRLPGIGARLAEKIIAELHGKCAKFALSRASEPLAVRETVAQPFEAEAIEILLQLQYRQAEAERMVREAVTSGQKIERVEHLIDLIFKNEQRQKVRV